MAKVETVKIPAPLAEEQAICSEAKALWGLVYKYHHEAVGGCFNSYKWLGQKLGIRAYDVKALINDMKSRGWIEQVDHPSSREIVKAVDCYNSPKSQYLSHKVKDIKPQKQKSHTQKTISRKSSKQ